MVFSTPLFLFGFLPLFFLAYALTPQAHRNLTVLAFSLAFYAWGEPVFVFVAIVSALFDLVAAQAIAKAYYRRAWLVADIIANVGLLAYFKYLDFGWSLVRDLAHAAFHMTLPTAIPIALPIGVSFIVFEKITYVVDVYRGNGRPAQRVTDYLAYVFLFPKLLAGPIIKYHDIERQIVSHPRTLDDVVEGLTRFAIGLAKKVLIADTMGQLADMAFVPGSTPGFALAWLGTLAFAMQIYFDFSGYSDMAIGLARTMGFRLMENFNRPYLSVGFREFWRRWHISLSSWIRDYLYIPLGGDRVPPWRAYLNLWICFLASGLWHGAAVTFIVWGAYQGLFITLEHMAHRHLRLALPRPLGVAATFLAVMIGWVIFRSPDLATAINLLWAMLHPAAVNHSAVIITSESYVTLAVALLICFAPGLPGFGRLQDAIAGSVSGRAVISLAATLLLTVSLAKAVTVAFHPFLYFRF